MAYDEELAERIRKALARSSWIVEKHMFGGVAFLLRGNMFVGVHMDALIARIAPDETDETLRQKDVRIFAITGRPMKGWILISANGVAGAKLAKWIERARGFVKTRPSKQTTVAACPQ